MNVAESAEKQKFGMANDTFTATSQAIDDVDDDEEVVVQGSVLQQVFSSFRDDFEVFTQQPVEAPARSSSETTSVEKRIDPTVMELVKMLCTSNLMLEEDADVLYYEDLEEIEERVFLLTKLKNILLLLGEKVWHFLSTGVLVILGFQASQAVDVNLWSLFFESSFTKMKATFCKLIAEMKGACDSVKKANSMIRLGFATLNSKTVELQFKLSSSQIQNHYYHRLENDLSLYTKSYCGFVVQTVRLLVMATKRIIGSSPHPDFYVATKLEERLNMLNESDNLSLSKVNELFNIFIITQSEYLRALGLFLTSQNVQFGSLLEDVSSLASAISGLRQSSAARLSRGIYSKSYEEKQIYLKKLDETAITKLDSTLTLLLTETFALKDYLREQGSTTELDVNILISNMSKIKNAVDESASSLQRVCNLIRKPSEVDVDSIANPLNMQETPDGDTNIVKPDIGVSDIDHKMAVGDRIYMCVIDDDDSEDNLKLSDSFLDDGSPEFPAPLLAELSFAVEKKRLEFEQREMEAIQKSDFKEMYNDFDLVVLHKPLLVNNPGKTTSRTTTVKKHPHDNPSPVPMPRQRTAEIEHTGPPLNASEYSLRKNVAALAASRSQQWERREEEIIGDSDSSGEQSDSEPDR